MLQKTISPIDNQVIFEQSYDSNASLLDRLHHVEAAHHQWRTQPLSHRIEICQQWLKQLQAAENVIAKDISTQMGRPIGQAAGELKGVFERVEYLCEIAPTALKQRVIDKQKKIVLEPCGIVLVIAPWNYPWLTAVNAIVPALLAGNGVLLKHSPQTPLSGITMVKTFLDAGLPQHLLQHIIVDHDQVEFMLQTGRIRCVNFTGSPVGGKAIQRAGANQLIRYNLELGGKDPAYVTEYADLDESATQLASGAFYNAGQSCCSIERIYVHKKVYPAFLDKFVQAAKTYQLNDPRLPSTKLGPVVCEAAAHRIQNIIDDAKQKGAEVICEDVKEPFATSCYVPWHIVCQTNTTMLIEKQEIFGPVVTVNVVDDDNMAVKKMNASQYGLSASVWTKNQDQAEKLAHVIETGTYFVNQCDYLAPELAWTGIKQSGLGWSLSELGFMAFVQPKSLWFNV